MCVPSSLSSGHCGPLPGRKNAGTTVGGGSGVPVPSPSSAPVSPVSPFSAASPSISAGSESTSSSRSSSSNGTARQRRSKEGRGERRQTDDRRVGRGLPGLSRDDRKEERGEACLGGGRWAGRAPRAGRGQAGRGLLNTDQEGTQLQTWQRGPAPTEACTSRLTLEGAANPAFQGRHGAQAAGGSVCSPTAQPGTSAVCRGVTDRQGCSPAWENLDTYFF